MVDKNDIATTIPTSTSVTAVADGEIVSAATENENNQKLVQIATLLYQFVRDDCPSLSVTNTFTAEQIFNVLKAQQIRPAITNGDLTLNPNGTGKVRYSDGSTDTEVASKGYVASVAFANGNVPPGGTAGNWLEGDGTWTDPLSRWQNQTGSFTAVVGGWYKMDEGSTVALPNPSAATEGEIKLKPKIGQDLTNSAATVTRFATEQIAGDSADLTYSTNIAIILTSNGTDWEVRREEIGRV